jgi:hypothetical protein
MQKTMTAKQLIRQKKKVFGFEGQWAEVFGQPEVGKPWIVYGGVGQGKTTFMMQLAKYLCGFGTVLYNSMEEGHSVSIQNVLVQERMDDMGNKMRLMCGDLSDMLLVLDAPRSPAFVMVDTLQYADMSFADYKMLKERYPDKTFIYLSHTDGRLPDGKTAVKIWRDCRIKVRIEGYKAFVCSSYSRDDNSEYVIWEEGAGKYYGTTTTPAPPLEGGELKGDKKKLR